MNVRMFGSWSEIAPLAEQWTGLVCGNPLLTVFQTYEWHNAWWRNFGADFTLAVACAFEGDSLRGVAPMMIANERFQRRPRRTLRFIGTANYASDYCNFIAAEDDSAPEVLNALLDILAEDGRWDIADLSRFPTDSPWMPIVQERLGRLFPVVNAHTEGEAPSRILRDPEEDRAIVDSKSFRRDTGWFEKRGPLRFSHLRGPGDEPGIQSRLDDFFRQHIERRALVGDRSQFLDPRQQQFYRDLTAAMLPRGWLRFAILDWNDVALAYHFGFELHDRFVLYKPTFNVEWVKKSPGKVLVKFLIEDAVARGLAEFDFTVGEESYKYRFANVIRTNTRFRAFRSRVDGSSYVLLERAKPLLRPVRDRLRAVLSRQPAAPPADVDET